MKRSQIIFFLVIVVVAIGLKLWSYRSPAMYVTLKGERLHVLVADTPMRQHRGLGDRNTLYPYHGMLFVFSAPSQYGFVMRDMRFPIDIVWFDKGKIVDIASRVVPEPNVAESDLTVYYPRAKADLVLELPAGWVNEHMLVIGDTITVNQK